ncbi:dipeptide ABC transporter ATP-binding protein [Labrys wisconsinensis]|uniref:Peptide/nickel transport system ATP-binding protein n=1 Tax=Labrys wisconsinensis TaxID=425677 RepID=A0ABU0JI19_9HYPH|nr:ABC transporter ATP-binding protein [Labrys wisconsinensis]MDQ0473936.1 peptide/nickel transport system ATP-binding protein [Labrys wisconsinensis]
MSTGHLVVEDLSVTLGQGAARRSVVRNISFSIRPGQAVALVGESGSGKSVTARTLVGLTGAGAGVDARRLSYAGRDLRGLSQAGWRSLRGRDIGFVLQDALVSLDPLRTVGQEILEALSAHGGGGAADHRRMLELLERVGVPEPALRARQRPDELSGGLRQRALIATALALEPAVLIADEPTTALDTTVQAQILDLLATIKQRGTGLLLISHDLAVVSQLADEVLVLNQGEVVEQGAMAQVLTRPSHPYTRALLDAVPGRHRRGIRPMREDRGRTVTRLAPRHQAVLEATDLSKTYDGPDQRRRLAVDAVSFRLEAGQTLGLIGESGSGKTTTARLALGLAQPDRGTVTFDGSLWVAAAPGHVPERLRRPRRPQLGVIYQDPLSSFDPRWTVGRILADALEAGGVPRPQHRERIAGLLKTVRLTAEHAARWPLQLSGGQRQRVAIARAIASGPKVIVCDEPVSALDVSVQAQILDLLTDLQDELGLSYLFISHDLGVIRHMSDAVLVMQDGKVVERGPVEQVFQNPQHDFTRKLLGAAPRMALAPQSQAAG